ncbi:hypothetical protein GQ457_17G014100 [Hibiscus cannabinus]
MQEVEIIQSKEVLRERTMAGSKSGKRASGRFGCFGHKRVPDLNIDRDGFGCMEVNGFVYVGGYGNEGARLSTVEVYDPDTSKWILIESLCRLALHAE